MYDILPRGQLVKLNEDVVGNFLTHPKAYPAIGSIGRVVSYEDGLYLIQFTSKTLNGWGEPFLPDETMASKWFRHDIVREDVCWWIRAELLKPIHGTLMARDKCALDRYVKKLARKEK